MDHRVSFVITARNEDPAVVASTVNGIVTTAAGVWHEIVIVDDASTEPVDITRAGVTIVRHSEPIGVTRAREAGTNASTGNILVWLDAHMTFEPGWLQAMLREVDSGALLCAPWRDYDRTHVHTWGSDFAWCESAPMNATAVLRLPSVESLLADPMLAAQLCRRKTASDSFRIPTICSSV